MIRLNIWRKTPPCFVFYYIWWIWSVANNFFSRKNMNTNDIHNPSLLQIRIWILFVIFSLQIRKWILFVRNIHEYIQIFATLWRRHAQTVRDSSLSYKIDDVILILSFLNPEGHQNWISGSKVMVILLKGLILHICGVASGRVCACSLRNGLVFTETIPR